MSESRLDDYRNHWEQERQRRMKPYASLPESFHPTAVSLSADLCCVLLRGEGIAKGHWGDGPDGEGLHPLDGGNLDRFSGYVRADEYLLVPHPLFRRAFSVGLSLNIGLIGTLVRLGDQHGVIPRIRYDESALGLADSLQEYVEMDYWRGPPVRRDLRNLTSEVLVHGEPDSAKRSLFGIDRVEMQVTHPDSDGYRSIKIEELHNEPTGPKWPEDDVSAQTVERFIHGQLSADGKVLHVDGSFRSYTCGEWNERKRTDIKHHGRTSKYTKTFRIDAPLDQSDFADLAVKYFWMNPLVGEMLEALVSGDEADE